MEAEIDLWAVKRKKNLINRSKGHEFSSVTFRCFRNSRQSFFPRNFRISIGISDRQFQQKDQWKRFWNHLKIQIFRLLFPPSRAKFRKCQTLDSILVFFSE